MKQKKRTRAKTNLVTVLQPIAKEKGRAFIKYDASKKVGAARLNADKLIAAADVLAAVHIAARGKLMHALMLSRPWATSFARTWRVGNSKKNTRSIGSAR